MKILLEIDPQNRLSEDELDAFRKQCEQEELPPEQRIAGLVRGELEKKLTTDPAG